MDSKKRIQSFVTESPSFAGLPPELHRRIVEESRLRTYKPKEIIFFEGDELAVGYYIAAGRVGLRKSSPSGKELIVALLFEQDPLGVVAVLDKRPLPLTAQAQSDCTVLEVPEPLLSAMFSAVPELYRTLLDAVGARLRSSHELSRAMAHDRADVRIAAALLMLSKNGELREVIASRQEISDLSGVTLETAVRFVRAWADEGMLKLHSTRSIEITDPARLAELAEKE